MLLITVSGLRYDTIDMEKMPNLAEFAQRSTQFTNHYSSGNNNNAGLVGLFYGLNASYTDSLLSNKTPSVLVERFAQQQYVQGLFSAKKFDSAIFRRAIYPKAKLSGDNSNQAAPNALRMKLNDFPSAISSRDNPCMCLGPDDGLRFIFTDFFNHFFGKTFSFA